VRPSLLHTIAIHGFRSNPLGVRIVLATILVAPTCAFSQGEPVCIPYLRGDANSDARVDIADPIAMLQHTFLGMGTIGCQRAADANGDATAADISDAIFVLLWSFAGGQPPAQPFPECGVSDVEEILGCETSPPCDGIEPCGGGDPGETDPIEWIELDEPVLEDIPPPLAVLEHSTVAVGSIVPIEISRIGPWSPARLEWGDGTTELILADDVVQHTYDRPRSALVRLIDRHGEARFEASVEVAPPATIRESHFVVPAAEGVAHDPFICAMSLLVGGDPASRHAISSACGLYLPGAPGPEVELSITTLGLGPIEIDVTLHRGGTFEPILDTIELHGDGAPNTTMISLPALPTDVPGTHVVIVESSGSGGGGQQGDGAAMALTAGGSAVASFTYTVFDPALLAADPNCQQIIALHAAARAEKSKKKADCDELAKKLEALLAELAGVEGDLASARGDLAAAEAARDEARAEAANLEAFVEGALGGVGDVTDYDSANGVPGGQNFVGAHGVGLAFGDAGAVIAQADAVEAATGMNPLAALGALGKARAELARREADAAALAAEVAALEARAAALEAEIAALRAALEDCRRECEELEGRIAELEATERRCLQALAERRKAEDAIRDAEEAVRSAENAAGTTSSSGDAAEDAVGGSAGSPEEVEDDRDAIEGAKEIAGAGSSKLEEAKRKLDEARDALAAGDSTRAAELAKEAAECAGIAGRTFAEATRDLEEARAGAAARGARECEEGSTYASDWVETRVAKRLVSIQIVPADVAPEDWNEHIESLREAVNALADFIEFVEAVKDHSPIEGTFTPEADKMVKYIFETYVGLLVDRAGVDVWALIEGCVERSRTHWVCVHGRWVVSRVEKAIEGPVFWQEKIGTVLATGPVREREVRELVERWVSSFVGR
jgi:hypothetical protein